MTYNQTGAGSLRHAKPCLEPNAVGNVKSYRCFHNMTLWFPAQIIKGRATSYHVEVYCLTWGVSAVRLFGPGSSGTPTALSDPGQRAS